MIICPESKAELINKITNLKIENKSLKGFGECIWKDANIDSCLNVYDTSCENVFEFVDGNPKDNNFKYCPYCGKALKEK